MHIKNKRGQSTVEYILLVTAVVAVMIVFTTSKNAPLQNTLNSTLNTATQDISEMGSKLSGSHTTPAPKAGDEPLSPVVVDPTKIGATS